MNDILAVLTPLFQQLDQNTIILTPNKRLSRFIQTQYALFQSNQAWVTLQCYSYSAWQQILWEEWQFSPSAPVDILQSQILSPNEEKFVWQNIINKYCAAHPELELFNTASTANVARTAWNTLVEWRCDPCSAWESSLANSEDTSITLDVFQAWASEFRAFCDENNCVDAASIGLKLKQAIEQKCIKLPHKIIFLAFDELSPLAKGIVQALKNSGVDVEEQDWHFGSLNTEPNTARVLADSYEDEIKKAAKWAESIIAKTTSVSIGIVIPNLISDRARVEDSFRRVFEPQYIFPQQSRHASGFNMSAGEPLASTPPIAAALLTLKLNFSEVDIEDVGLLLNSPFIGSFSELSSRSMLNASLREECLQVSVTHLRSRAAEFGLSKESSKVKGKDKDKEKPANNLNKAASEKGQYSLTQDFYNRLHLLHQASLNELGRKKSEKLLPSEWAETFNKQLGMLGWPGERTLDTLEYQQVNVWQELLNGFGKLDAVFPSMSFNDAYTYLSQISQDTQFQAQTTTSPVQVLGVLEAAGMLFDHVWVMNLDNDHWPPAPKPNALIPLALQKQLNMPRSSAERELNLAKSLTQRFCFSAKEVVFSSATHDGDKDLSVSPLIEAIPFIALQKTEHSIGDASDLDYQTHLFNLGKAEEYLDSCGPYVPNPKNIRGGTQILKDQAACPFRSFARHRLHTRQVPDAMLGLSPAERGSLIHNALELIWKRIGDYSTLINLKDEELDSILNESIRQSFYRLKNKNIGTQLTSLETQRILPLLRAWLELEKQRKPFVVVHNEAQKSMQLNKLPINIRYDRVDRLEDGSLFIIDYKTGKLDTKSWAGPRPDEPQVPIYSIANEKHVAGAAFGQINVEQVAIKGIASDTDIAPGLSAPELLTRLDLPDTWQDILVYWRAMLENLAKEFIAGVADVQPKHPTTTCQFCDLHSLCRIKETSTAEDESSDPETQGAGDE